VFGLVLWSWYLTMLYLLHIIRQQDQWEGLFQRMWIKVLIAYFKIQSVEELRKTTTNLQYQDSDWNLRHLEYEAESLPLCCNVQWWSTIDRWRSWCKGQIIMAHPLYIQCSVVSLVSVFYCYYTCPYFTFLFLIVR
jgi:hypothetical protein